MNQTQRKYFIERVREIAKTKLDEIWRARSEKENALKSVHARALDYLTEHPGTVSAQLLELTRTGLSADNDSYFEIDFSSGHGRHPIPAFYTACVDEYNRDLAKIVAWETAKKEKIRAEEQRLLDRAYFDDLPAEFIKLLEKFAALKV